MKKYSFSVGFLLAFMQTHNGYGSEFMRETIELAIEQCGEELLEDLHGQFEKLLSITAFKGEGLCCKTRFKIDSPEEAIRPFQLEWSYSVNTIKKQSLLITSSWENKSEIMLIPNLPSLYNDESFTLNGLPYLVLEDKNVTPYFDWAGERAYKRDRIRLTKIKMPPGPSKQYFMNSSSKRQSYLTVDMKSYVLCLQMLLGEIPIEYNEQE
jgi:hypothetical protein